MKALPLALALCLVSTAFAKSNDWVSAELIANTTAVQAGQPFTVGLLLHVAPDMHVYWINPGDGGGPIRLTWNLPAGYTAGPLQFPVPDHIAQPGGLTIYGYENQVLLTTQITPPAAVAAGDPVALQATAHWVVCSTAQCYFGQRALTLNLPTGQAAPANQAVFDAWQPRMPQPESDAFTSVDVTPSANATQLTFHWKSAAPPNLYWFPGPSDEMTVRAQSLSTRQNVTVLTLSITPLAGIPQKTPTITGILSYHQDSQPPRGVAVSFDRKL